MFCFYAARAIIAVLILPTIMLPAVAAFQAPMQAASTVAPSKPTPAVQALLDLGIKAMQEKRLPDALNYLAQAQKAAIKTGDKTGNAATALAIGMVYYALGKPQQARDSHQQVLNLWQSGKTDVFQQAQAVMTSYNSLRLASFGQTLAFLQQGISFYKQTGNKNAEAFMEITLGSLYQMINQPEKAQDYFEQALPLCRETGNTYFEAAVLSGLGSVYSRRQQGLAKARELYQKAYALYRARNYSVEQAATLNVIGKIYSNERKDREALDCFEQVQALCQKNGNKRSEAEALFNIGLVYRDQGQATRAIPYFQ